MTIQSNGDLLSTFLLCFSEAFLISSLDSSFSCFVLLTLKVLFRDVVVIVLLLLLFFFFSVFLFCLLIYLVLSSFSVTTASHSNPG